MQRAPTSLWSRSRHSALCSNAPLPGSASSLASLGASAEGKHSRACVLGVCACVRMRAARAAWPCGVHVRVVGGAGFGHMMLGGRSTPGSGDGDHLPAAAAAERAGYCTGFAVGAAPLRQACLPVSQCTRCTERGSGTVISTPAAVLVAGYSASRRR